MLTFIRRGLLLAAVCASYGQAQAVLTVTQAPNAFGDFSDITYGNGGNLFELQPYLFVNGLGGASDAKSVVGLNSALDFSFSWGQSNANTVVVQYRISNLSETQSFDNLRFMVFANPDGDSQDYADRVTESWGAATPGGPTRRQVFALPGAVFDNVVSTFKANNNLADGAPSGACAAATGCDATLGLQWNAAQLKPGESWLVQVGLSDAGSRDVLSARWLMASAVNSPNTSLTLSGLATVSAVPEPGALPLLLAGLLAVGTVVRQRSRSTHV
jgi:hypothetical protein